jgi:hypothetical protein
MSTAGWIIGVGVSGLWSSLFLMDAIDEVNLLLPKEKQFPTVFNNFAYFSVRREYHRLCPVGKLLKKSDAMAALMFVFLLLAIITAFLSRN